tara:strand:- start:40510 stop:40962 length:453 start_codon:yes stop_codon:yes gene_type:complete
MVYGDVEFSSVDYFCTSIRNDFLSEIKIRDNAMRHILKNSVSYFVNINQADFVRDSLDKKITSKNKIVLNYFFSRINNLSEEFNRSKLAIGDRVKKMKFFCDDLVKNKEILRQFPFFNDSFINMMLRFSKEEVWGMELSFSYFEKYFSSD